MKLSYNIVIAAFLGTMSQAELAQAVERHHHHQEHYTQFMPQVHPQGVVLLKDFGLANNGYPYQSLSIVDQEPAAKATPESIPIVPKDTADRDIKLPKVQAEIPDPNDEKAAQDKALTADAKDANLKKADYLEK